VVLLVGVGMLSLAGCVADPPPVMGTAVAGNGEVTVSWAAPPSNPLSIAAYEIQPYIEDDAQPTVRFDSTATTQTVTGLTNGATYRFYVRAISTLGNESAWSELSNPVTPLAASVATAAGNWHSCALFEDGIVQCWGDNLEGQIGSESVADSSTPLTISGITTATAVSAGGRDTCALLVNGTVECWGVVLLPNGSLVISPAPVPISGVTNATAITSGSGDGHSCAVLASGTVKCWGDNTWGQLGNGTRTSAGVAVTVSGITNATDVAAGQAHTCASLADGTVKCWGLASDGILGDGRPILPSGSVSTTPVSVIGISSASSVTAGAAHTCARLSDGTARCWGVNLYGQLGNGTTDTSSAPVTVDGITTATNIDAGYLHTCAALADDDLHCWGRNDRGQLGNGSTTDSSTPGPVTGITVAPSLDAGGSHTCVARPEDGLSCWGWNGQGQLGTGTYTDSWTPVPVTGL
jgi:alpha-tubulin suppressor-like RCC1 family protein